MKYSYIAILAFSTQAMAIDYSNCEKFKHLQGRVDDKGKIVPRKGEIIHFIKDNGDNLDVTFKSEDPRNPVETKVNFKLNKEDQVIGVKHDLEYSKLDRKQRDKIKSQEAYRFAFGHFPGRCYQWANDTGNTKIGDCASIMYSDNGVYKPVDYDSINEQNYKNYKISNLPWEEFVKIREDDKKAWAEKEKIASSYEKFLDQTGWDFYSGEQADLKLENGVCVISKVSDIMTNGKTGASQRNVAYDLKSCDAISQVYDKHEKELNQCNVTNATFKEDFYSQLGNYSGNVMKMPGANIKISRSGNATRYYEYESPFSIMKRNCEVYAQLKPKAKVEEKKSEASEQ